MGLSLSAALECVSVPASRRHRCSVHVPVRPWLVAPRRPRRLALTRWVARARSFPFLPSRPGGGPSGWAVESTHVRT